MDAVHDAVARVGAHDIAYRWAGPSGGVPVVLLHGMAADSTTWNLALGPLAERGLRVYAPDLLGHGNSAKPPAGYLLAEFAAGLHGFITALGLERPVIGGHSFGGAVAMQCAFQFPDLAQGLILVSAGGLGKQVHPVLRAASLPGSGTLIRAAASVPVARALRRTGVQGRMPPDLWANLRRSGHALRDPAARAAFLATLRGVIRVAGQRGSMIDMGRVLRELPTLVVWSGGDRIIPASHGRALTDVLAHGRLEVFPGSSHEPHRRFTHRFADVVAEFVDAVVHPAQPDAHLIR